MYAFRNEHMHFDDGKLNNRKCIFFKFIFSIIISTVTRTPLMNTTLADDPGALLTVSCPPLFPPQHGYLECSRPLETVGSGDPITNRPGSQCVLRCPTGYRVVGAFEQICGFNGRWIGKSGGQCLSGWN